ncbi:hypothetical protein OAU96_04070 [Planctomycetota bacterium]|nr:hypothetical protein [Planctomycetota bacterium]
MILEVLPTLKLDQVCSQWSSNDRSLSMVTIGVQEPHVLLGGGKSCLRSSISSGYHAAGGVL